jgi:hypothetical protein
MEWTGASVKGGSDVEQRFMPPLTLEKLAATLPLHRGAAPFPPPSRPSPVGK